MKKCLILVLIVVLAVGCVPKRAAKKVGPTEAPAVEFVVEESKTLVATRGAAGRAQEITAVQEAESGKIIDFLQDYFEQAFVVSDYWKNGQFESVLSPFFAPQILEAARKDLTSLSLKGYASKLKSTKRVEARIPKLWISYDGSLRPTIAAAEVHLEITYQSKEDKVLLAKISGTLTLEPNVDGKWQIFGYQVKREFLSEEKDKK